MMTYINKGNSYWRQPVFIGQSPGQGHVDKCGPYLTHDHRLYHRDSDILYTVSAVESPKVSQYLPRIHFDPYHLMVDRKDHQQLSDLGYDTATESYDMYPYLTPGGSERVPGMNNALYHTPGQSLQSQKENHDSSVYIENYIENEPNRHKDVKSILTNFADYTSLQGIPYIKRSTKWWSKAFWALVFLAGCGMAGLQLYHIFDNYFSWPFSTVVELGFDALEFPSVTVCNLNPVRTGVIPKYDQELYDFLDSIRPDSPEPAVPVPDDEGNSNSEGTSTGQNQPSWNRQKRQTAAKQDKKKRSRRRDHQLTDSVSKEHENYENFLKYYGNVSIENRREMGSQAEDFIVSCSFNGFDCSWQNFSFQASPEYGNCYTFNNPELQDYALKAYRSGIQFGLQLVLFLEEPEYPAGIAPTKGASVVIHPYNTMSFPEINGVMLQPGLDTNIGIKMLNITRLGKPYSRCYKDSDFEKNYNHKYTQEACLNTCFYETIVEKCGCYLKPFETYHPPDYLDKYPACVTDEDYGCAFHLKTELRTSETSCQHCEAACHEQSYELVSSSSYWPDKSFEQTYKDIACATSARTCKQLDNAIKEERGGELADGEKTTTIRENFLRLKIYYRELNYEIIRQQKDYDVATFASDIGGTLGLWIGVSVLSGVEILQLCLELIRHMCRRKIS